MPNHLTLVEMAHQVRTHGLSPVELTEAHLRQIEKHNPKLNAFVVLLAEEARREARQREAAVMRGEQAGPLDGVPVTVKDSFDMAGLPTLCGSKLRADHRAAADSTAVSRLRRAGAVILGKTNCPEFLMNYETDNYTTGRTNNPWDPERTPGGSSGGESAAIAAFCSAGGIGSDGGGSIRVPAHFTGITGLKPTPGRVPATGHYPVIAHPGGLLGVAGPLARTAKDLALLFQVLAGYDAQDPFSAPVPLRKLPVEGMRIGMMAAFGDAPLEPPIQEAVEAAGKMLAEAGFRVEPFTPSGLDRAVRVWDFFFKDLPVTVVRELLSNAARRLHWTGRELWDQVLDKPEPSVKDVLEMLALRDKLRGKLLAEMERFPVLLWPACGVVTFHHRQREWQTPEGPLNYNQAVAPLTPANALGLPAMSVPVSMTGEGLPVGVQLIGRPFEEERLLELAVRLEDVRGPFPSPPGY